ncbi:MAG: 2-phospho-L-lactate guanylyltransferase [Clostridia bacterium]
MRPHAPLALAAIVPVKDPRQGKSRLADLLSAESRHALNVSLARRTIEVCAEVFGGGQTIVVTDSAEIGEIARMANAQVLPEPDAARTLADPYRTSAENALNAAIRAGIAMAQRQGAEGVAIIPTDLPLLSGELLRPLLEALPRHRTCTLVPDRRDSGTNVMVMSPAQAALVDFGAGSLARHAARASELGYDVRIHRCESLGLDLDLPEDFHSLQEQHPWRIFASTTSTPSASRLASTRT